MKWEIPIILAQLELEKSKEFELGHASLNALQEQYLSLQEKTLSYYQSIYQYNIDVMNFVSLYGD